MHSHLFILMFQVFSQSGFDFVFFLFIEKAASMFLQISKEVLLKKFLSLPDLYSAQALFMK